MAERAHAKAQEEDKEISGITERAGHEEFTEHVCQGVWESFRTEELYVCECVCSCAYVCMCVCMWGGGRRTTWLICG